MNVSHMKGRFSGVWREGGKIPKGYGEMEERIPKLVSTCDALQAV